MPELLYDKCLTNLSSTFYKKTLLRFFGFPSKQPIIEFSSELCHIASMLRFC